MHANDINGSGDFEYYDEMTASEEYGSDYDDDINETSQYSPYAHQTTVPHGLYPTDPAHYSHTSAENGKKEKKPVGAKKPVASDDVEPNQFNPT